MSPEVLTRKLKLMTIYLKDLKGFKNITFEEYLQNHYTIERILELLIMTACDIIFHLLSERNEPPPTTYSSAFKRAGELGLIERKLSEKLAQAAGMRNILVHGYEEIDNQLVYGSISDALKSFNQFINEMKKQEDQ